MPVGTEAGKPGAGARLSGRDALPRNAQNDLIGFNTGWALDRDRALGTRTGCDKRGAEIRRRRLKPFERGGHAQAVVWGRKGAANAGTTAGADSSKNAS